MSGLKPKAILILVAIGLGLGGFLLVQQKRQEMKEAPEYGQRPRPVTVSQARQGDLKQKKHYLAVVRPQEEAGISARVQAEVREVLVDEGDRVQAGQVLLRLDPEEIKHRLQEVKARISQAEAELEAKQATILYLESSQDYWQKEAQRLQKLAQQNAATASEAEKTEDRAKEVQGRLQASRAEARAIRSRMDSLQQQMQEIKTRLSYYTLRSPGPGVISKRNADPGDMASPAQELLQLQQVDSLKLAFDLPQQDLPLIEQGQECIFQVQGQARKARISLLHPSLDKARMLRAEARLQGEQIKGLSPGEFVPLSVVVEEHKAVTLVPRSALIQGPEGREHVFVVREGKLEPKGVQVLGYSRDRAAVKGLEPGADVVRNTYLGWARLSSGQRVEAVR
ncbi:MAG: efflux RND transporter periplasmic adaptor subunit [Desulfohalobiaceae bacterium]